MSSSTKESPKQHAFSGVADAFYDAEFSVNISKKMQVPDSIRLAGNRPANAMNDLAARNQTDPKLLMHVPERICVAGGETHLSTREQLPELKLENTLLGKPQDQDELVQLTTPPRTLRVADTQPSFDPTPIKQLDKALRTVEQSNRSRFNDTRMNDSIMDLDDSELSSQSYVQLRRRLLMLGQRVDSLEIENSRRNKRDLMLYTFGFLYMLFRGVTWLTSRNRINYF